MIVFEERIALIHWATNTMPEGVRDILKQPLVEAQIIDMNVAQMDAGKASDSADIEPPYALFTVAMKQMKGQQADFVTLKDEGDFHASVSVKYGANEFELFATDIKTNDLVAKYGSEIFGLTDPHMSDLRDEAFPYILELARLNYL